MTRVTDATPFTANCEGIAQRGVNSANLEVEPSLAVDPTNPMHLIGVWQQDRWSNGGARGPLTGVSFDGGKTWTRSMAHLSRCAGGTAANGGDYERASDPWVTIGPTGVAYQASISFAAENRGGKLPNAVLVSRSDDGGLTWSEPVTLSGGDDPDLFVDKETATADPTDSRYVYAVWDRLTGQTIPNNPNGTGPAWFARSVDGLWETAKPIYDPGVDAQTIGNQIAVLPNKTLIDVFVEMTQASSSSPVGTIRVVRSVDQGANWSPPITVRGITPTNIVDANAGHDIRTGEIVPTIAADPASGKVYVVWQDAQLSGGARNAILLSASADSGATWSAPVGVNKVPTTHAFTPALAVSATGRIGVTYYDLREQDPNDRSHFFANAWMVTSLDGVSWDETPIGGSFDLRAALVGNEYFLGDYEGLAAVGETFVPLSVLANTGNSANPTDAFVRVP